LIAAGGIGTGRQMLAAFALGAEGVQIGTRFVCTNESSAHINFKQKVASLNEGDTQLSMKKVVPVRLIKNDFFNAINEAENRGAEVGELVQILGRARAKKGMHEGDMNEGELEIGQVSSLIDKIIPASDVVSEIIAEFEAAKNEISNIKF
jgi:enoyl-[acyl-carrier protein] reductase II